jgi:hypothetical protein
VTNQVRITSGPLSVGSLKPEVQHQPRKVCTWKNERSLKQWIGRDSWDAAFDLHEANSRLAEIKL